MNKTVKLVNEWARFEENHPEGTIEEFCRHYLASHDRQTVRGPLVGGVIPATPDGLLMKIIGRISKLNMLYANLALEGTELNQIEEFGLLVTIRQERNPKKTEVIYANLFELSSGTDMLNRLKKRGLIKEYDDQEDKRAKRIELTAKGKKVTDIAFKRVIKNAKMMAHSLTDDDKKLCIQLLKKIEMTFSAVWPQHRNRKFDEVYEEVMNIPEY